MASSAAPQPVAPPGKPFSLPEIAFLLLWPPVAYLALSFEWVMQNHMLDPYMYTGYIHNFHQLFLRYGITYYGVRFGLILPARATTAIFGADGGYFVLRYLLSLVFGIPLYAVCRRYLSLPVAIFTYLLAISSPYLARALLWDHPDATGVPFLTAAICLWLLGSDPKRARWDFIAGCCFSMALNSNIFTLGIGGIFGGSYLALCILYKKELRKLFRRVLIAALGAIAVSAAGALYYRLATGYWEIFGITLAMMRALSAGGMEQWRAHGLTWTINLHQVYIPVWLSLCCAAALIVRRNSFQSTMLSCYGLCITAFYYVHQFLMHADTLQLFYYFSYAMPAIFLMLAVLYQRLYIYSAISSTLFLVLAAASAILPWILYSFGCALIPVQIAPIYTVLSKLTLPNVPWNTMPARNFLAFLTTAIVFLVIWIVLMIRRGNKGQPVLAVAALLFLGAGYDVGFAEYAYTIHGHFKKDTSERDVYHVALQLIKAVPAYDGQGKILFWYNNRPNNPIDSIQSTYLWGFSKLNTNPPDDPGLPRLFPSQVERLRDPGVRYLVLLCDSPVELEQGLAALRDAAVPFQLQDRRVLASGSYRIYFATLDLRKQ